MRRVVLLAALLTALGTAHADDDVPGNAVAGASAAPVDEDGEEGEPADEADDGEADEDEARPAAAAALLEVTADLKGHHGRLVRALAFSPDGSVLATSGSDRSIRLWHVGAARAKAVAAVPPSD